MDRGTFEELRRAPWPEIGPKLLRAGLAITGDIGALGRHLTPSDVEDLVTQAIEQVLSGAAVWDPSRGELYPFLKVVFRRRLIDRLRAKRPGAPLEVVDNSAATAPSAEDKLISMESDAVVTRRVASVFELCDEDEEAKIVLEAIMSDEGDHRPRVIAGITGFPVGRVNTARAEREAALLKRRRVEALEGLEVSVLRQMVLERIVALPETQLHHRNLDEATASDLAELLADLEYLEGEGADE